MNIYVFIVLLVTFFAVLLETKNTTDAIYKILRSETRQLKKRIDELENKLYSLEKRNQRTIDLVSYLFEDNIINYKAYGLLIDSLIKDKIYVENVIVSEKGSEE